VMWTTSSVDQEVPAGTLVFVPQNAAGAAPYEQGPLVLGQVVAAPADAFARVTLPNGTVVILESSGRAEIGQDGRSIDLYQGAARIAAQNPTTIRVEDLALALRPGVSWIMVSQRRVTAFMFRGSATLSATGEARELAAGQVAHWNKEMRKLSVRQSTTPIPSWVDEILEYQRGR
jgi:hypothetical protein